VQTPPFAAQDGQRIHSVDGLRALAFLLVFAFHTWEFAGHPYVPIVSGVVSQNTRPDFFVVLTGFVLFLPFARNPARTETFEVRPYLRRRLRRIVLPYYVALAIAILLPQLLVVMVRAAGGSASWQPFPPFADVLTHLTFTHIFFPEYWAGINGSLWTMSLEMQLYLILPLLILLFARFGWKALGWALVISLAYRVIVGLWLGGEPFPVPFLVGANGLGRLMEFLAGMAAAWLAFRWRHALTPVVGAFLTLLIVLGYLVAIGDWPAWTGLRELALGLTFGCVIVVGIAGRRVEMIFAWRPMSWIGFRAYSLFLVHQPVAWYFSEMLTKYAGVEDGPLKLALMWTVGFLPVLGVGLLLFRLVELPCIRWAKATPRSTPRQVADAGPPVLST